MDDHPEWREEAAPQKGYAMSGKIMLSAIVVLFTVVVFMVGLHLYARWYLLRARRRHLERRRQRRASRSQLVLISDSRQLQAAADRGLDVTVLNSLPVFLYSSGAAEEAAVECAVCLSEFEEKEIVRLLPKCRHRFHVECIGMWFHSHSTCPLCRSPVEKVEESRSKPAEEGNSGDRGKVGISIDVPARVVPENELSQISPASRLSALRRILSMGRKSPAAGGSTTARGAGAGSSRVAAELDLESGPDEPDPAQVGREKVEM
ncbi:RING-H2 finger protein ATL2-like [Andrographis paniculata]|uniref:RING-H2 finger protein ATL2-like n=1 Tax=Andrographis paniculata TaxID=175694 RepID=UPI0021E6F646|nr:RING-H2 finger protein ATL2-like [Andrographis paniculata]